MNDDDIPLDANGPAYTSSQERHGVPLNYVGEKLGSAIEELHRFAANHPQQRADLIAPMYYLLVSGRPDAIDAAHGDAETAT